MILLKIDPNVVRPGWIALLIVIALAVVVGFLVWSMRRQVRRIQLPGDTGHQTGEPASEQDTDQQTSTASSAADPDR